MERIRYQKIDQTEAVCIALEALWELSSKDHEEMSCSTTSQVVAPKAWVVPESWLS